MSSMNNDFQNFSEKEAPIKKYDFLSPNLNQVFVGEVVDNADPDNLGRVKVRIFNIHDENETETLPWALYLGTGKERIVPEKGDYVAILFLNGQVELPVYLGTLNMESIGISSTKENQSKADVIFENRNHDTYIKNEPESLQIIKNSSPNSSITISSSKYDGSVKLGVYGALTYDKVVVENKLRNFMQMMVNIINTNFQLLNIHVHPGQTAITPMGPAPVTPTPPTPSSGLTISMYQNVCSDSVLASIGTSVSEPSFQLPKEIEGININNKLEVEQFKEVTKNTEISVENVPAKAPSSDKTPSGAPANSPYELYSEDPLTGE